MSHTPGPWKLIPRKPGDGFHQIESEGRVYVAMTTFESNARLIAAAPQLLAALKRVFNDGLVHDKGCEQMPCDCWISKALSAIARAEGR